MAVVYSVQEDFWRAQALSCYDDDVVCEWVFSRCCATFERPGPLVDAVRGFGTTWLRSVDFSRYVEFAGVGSS